MKQQTLTRDSTRYDFVVESFDDSTHYGRLLKLVGTNKRVLELGCSTGYLSEAMTRHFNCRVTAIEVDSKAAREANGKCHRVIVADLNSCNLEEILPDEQFDVVLCADVLEHLTDPLRTVKELHRWLVPGGYIVSSIPNVAHGSVRLALLHGQFPYRPMGLLDETHVRFFNRAGIEELFENAGFKIEYVGRNRWSILASDTGAQLPNSAQDFLKLLRGDPDSETYQFIIKAIRREVKNVLGVVQKQAISIPKESTRDSCESLPKVDIVVFETETAQIDEIYRRYLSLLNYPEHLRQFILVSETAPHTVVLQKLSFQSRPYGDHDFRSYRFVGPGDRDNRFLTDGSDICAASDEVDKQSNKPIDICQHLKNDFVFICDANSYPTSDTLLNLVWEAKSLGPNDYLEARCELDVDAKTNELYAFPRPVLLARALLERILHKSTLSTSDNLSLPLLNHNLTASAKSRQSTTAFFFPVGFVLPAKKAGGWLGRLTQYIGALSGK